MSTLSPAQLYTVPLIAETILGGLEERVTNAGVKQREPVFLLFSLLY